MITFHSIKIYFSSHIQVEVTCNSYLNFDAIIRNKVLEQKVNSFIHGMAYTLITSFISNFLKIDIYSDIHTICCK